MTKDLPPQQSTWRSQNEPGPSVSPPTFEESTGHLLIDFDQPDPPISTGDQEPPPDFTPYDAEFFVSSDGSIISHDPHLNEDGEALYRFLLSQANATPTYKLHCKGAHTENRTRLVNSTNSRGQSQTRTENYTETVTDFDFFINVNHDIPSRPTQWTLGDEEPAYRGRMIREAGIPVFTRKASRAEAKEAKVWRDEREAHGIPPWIAKASVQLLHPTIGMEMPLMRDVTKSSWTLRQWADDYCASPKYLKEFVYEKVLYGWNVGALTTAIHSAILSVHYTGNITVKFELSLNRVIVRPDTRLSRALSNRWLKFLLIITLIYPFIWLFKRFHSRGGGRWAIAGSAYALKKYTPLQDEEVDDSQLGRYGPRGKYVQTREGVQMLVGVREGEWFQRWEGTIRRAIAAKKVDRTPMEQPDDIPEYNTQVLDGYSS
ncbi:hypothetical protein EW146_g33 [Bondarzewia mesenterica]|uniref:Uncharacterized protein n=1 Tax=Bondarzewia mesenterica TaxID=1095465 RepID=A0A4S4M8J7_9AGAM|nr:hypothetical protein EW146_g33 [Bondarzewia mesenterica]